MSNTKYQIKRVDLKKGLGTLELVKGILTKDGRTDPRSVVESSNMKCTKDFQDAFDALIPHHILLCEVPGFTFSEDYLEDNEILKNNAAGVERFFVSGVAISDDGAVNLIGGIKTKGGRVISMTAPLTGINEETEGGYQWKQILADRIKTVLDEAEAYLDGKIEPSAQTSMDLDTAGKSGKKETEKVK